MNSSKKSQHQILGVLPTGKVEQLLLDWANLPQWRGDFAARAARYHRQDISKMKPADLQRPPAYERIVRRYPEVFSHVSEHSVEVARIVGELLRKAWDASDLRKREWYLADAESYYHRTALGRFGEPTDRPTELEAVLYYFRRNVERALHCPNVDCPAPYFLGVKKGQRYCSVVCALPAQRESKRRWWNKNKKKKAR